MKAYTGQFSAQEIYGLFWQPEKEKEIDFLNQHKSDLEKSAREILNSTSWRMTFPLRLPFQIVLYFLNGLQFLVNSILEIIGRFLAIIGKIFYKFFISWSKISDMIGPLRVNVRKDKVEKLHSFVLLAPKSLSLKLPQLIYNIFHKE